MKSLSVIYRALALALVLAAVSLGSCSSSHMQAGTDGVTHWLRDCDTSAECGDLQCLCGVCTRTCEQDGACSELGESAQCASLEGGSCTLESMVCQRADSEPSGGTGGAGGPDAAVQGGRDGGGGSVVMVDGGGAGGGGGPRDSGPVDPEPAACAPMDARSNGTLCARTVGYTWNGTACEPVLCGCAGSECDEVYATESECRVARSGCLELTSCNGPAQCELAPKACCACSDLGLGDVVSIAANRRNDYELRTCSGVDCVACEMDPLARTRARVAAVCNLTLPSMQGYCGTLDLTRLPCTEEVGCRPRVPSCCECGAQPSLDELFAMPNDFDVAGTFCANELICCDELPVYPDNVEARCVNAVCELFEDGVLVPR